MHMLVFVNPPELEATYELVQGAFVLLSFRHFDISPWELLKSGGQIDTPFHAIERPAPPMAERVKAVLYIIYF